MLGGSCLFISLIICDFIDLNSGHIKPMSCEIWLNTLFGFILKGIELFLISFLILYFENDRAALYSCSKWLWIPSYFNISFSSFKIM